MRTFLFVLASAATLSATNVAIAQSYLPPPPGSNVSGPGYTGGYAAPGYAAPDNASSGYMWREQRANEDWRNKTWREQRYKENWRSNDWRAQRANEDWQQREDYNKGTTPNNVVDRGYANGATTTATANTPGDKNSDCVFGSGGLAKPCLDLPKDKARIDRSEDGVTNQPAR